MSTQLLWRSITSLHFRISVFEGGARVSQSIIQRPALLAFRKSYSRAAVRSTSASEVGVVAIELEESLNRSGDAISKHSSTYRFIDEVSIAVHGGKGGNGCISFEIQSPSCRKPSGGNGGDGGNVYISADRRLSSLRLDTHHFRAASGSHGGSDGMTGRTGKDVHIRVPLGTIVREVPSQQAFEQQQRIAAMNNSADADIDTYGDGDGDDGAAVGSKRARSSYSRKRATGAKTHSNAEQLDDIDGNSDTDDDANYTIDDGPEYAVHELDDERTVLLVAKGGAAGQGNKALMSGLKKAAGRSVGARLQSMPQHKVPGQLGETRMLHLEMKIIADVGLVGFPNAGKSSVLRALSNAVPKVAAYPFTTLHPNVGIVEYSDLVQLSVADIPGLIDGAHEDRGLGHDFLRHIERTKMLLFVVDVAEAASAVQVSPAEGTIDAVNVADAVSQVLSTLLLELRMYDSRMLERPVAVFLNKVDLLLANNSAGFEDSNVLELQNAVQRWVQQLLLLDNDSRNSSSAGHLHMMNEDKVRSSTAAVDVLVGSAAEGVGIAELARILRVNVLR